MFASIKNVVRIGPKKQKSSGCPLGIRCSASAGRDSIHLAPGKSVRVQSSSRLLPGGKYLTVLSMNGRALKAPTTTDTSGLEVKQETTRHSSANGGGGATRRD